MDVGDYVHRKGTERPTGIVEAVNGNLTATVRWGVADNRVYLEEIPQEELEILWYNPKSPDEVTKRQAEEAQVPFHVEKEFE